MRRRYATPFQRGGNCHSGLKFTPCQAVNISNDPLPDFGTSAQVLQEFFVTVVKKAAHPLSAAEALEWIEQWRVFPCQPIDHQLVRIAIEQSERYAISYWDAAILVTAGALGSQIVYSEDLNAGQSYGRVKVVNPFS
jgi:predicted nucleic acid-binding protein